MKVPPFSRPYWRAALLGTVGLSCGYWGPLHFTPSATMGPLLGIFLTGPAGMALGFGFEWFARRSKLNPFLRESTFVGIACVLAVATIFLSQPTYEISGFLIDGEITRCESSSIGAQRAVQEWDARLQGRTKWVRDGWREGVATMLERDRGVVVEVLVHRRREVRQLPGEPQLAGLRIGPWTDQAYSFSYFTSLMGDRCESYPLRHRSIYWDGPRHLKPPLPYEALPDFLGLPVLDSVPPELRQSARE